MKNAWTYPITVNQVGAEYPAWQNCGFPLSPGGLILQPGMTGTMTGSFAGCGGGPQTVWLLINGNGMKQAACDYFVSYSPVSQSFGVQWIDSMSGDHDCKESGDSKGNATIVYDFAGEGLGEIKW